MLFQINISLSEKGKAHTKGAKRKFYFANNRHHFEYQWLYNVKIISMQNVIQIYHAVQEL